MVLNTKNETKNINEMKSNEIKLNEMKLKKHNTIQYAS